MLSEPTGEGASRWTSAGHASVYFSRICPESPVRMRLCGAGEPGSVLSTYNGFGEDRPYEWNLVPVNVFLYGVENENDRPLFAAPGVRRSLQERFLAENLTNVCTEPACSGRRAHWRDMVAATFARKIYLFQVKTTLQQDLNLIAKFNASPNVGHYNGLTNNCADFAREVINTYFPGVARPDHLNDFGMTSPKAIAKSFSHYAAHHPELEFHVLRFAQIPGDFKPSSDCRKGTEVAFRSKKWLLPMLLKSHELAMFAASYMLTGRFNPEREVERRPTEQVAAVEAEMAAARWDKHDDILFRLREEVVLERYRTMGTAGEWKTYAAELDRLIDQAVEKGLITDRKSLRRTFIELDARGKAWVDGDGGLWLDVAENGTLRRTGISASNIDAPDSDPELAYVIMLSRMDAILRSPAKAREMMPLFKADWELLERTQARLWPDSAQIIVASAPGVPPAKASSKSAGKSVVGLEH